MIERIRSQLPAASAAELEIVLQALADGAAAVLRADLIGVHLTGSFAMGSADLASDVDFLVVSRGELTARQEQSARALHRRLPDRAEHWAHHLDGSWITASALRGDVGAHPPGLHVDNGSREMERSRHDDTANARWVLRHGGIPVVGPDPAALLGEVGSDDVRREAVEQAAVRSEWLREHSESYDDAWAQPYAVLTFCRLIYSAETGRVGPKGAAAAWVRDTVAPAEFTRLISDAIAGRMPPSDATPGASRSRPGAESAAFVEWAVGEVQRRAKSIE